MISEAKQAALLKSIKAFLDSPSVPKNPNCPDCGAVLVHAQADFSLYGSERVWSVPLPFCPHCLDLTVNDEKHSSELTH